MNVSGNISQRRGLSWLLDRVLCTSSIKYFLRTKISANKSQIPLTPLTLSNNICVRISEMMSSYENAPRDLKCTWNPQGKDASLRRLHLVWFQDIDDILEKAKWWSEGKRSVVVSPTVSCTLLLCFPLHVLPVCTQSPGLPMPHQHLLSCWPWDGSLDSGIPL